MASRDDEETSNGGDSVEEEALRLLRRRERQLNEQRDRSVSDLVIRVNEPDIYTPTLDLSKEPVMAAQQDLLRRAATKPGLRRQLRTEGVLSARLPPAVSGSAAEEAEAAELRGAVERYDREQRRLAVRTVPIDVWLVLLAGVVCILVLVALRWGGK